MKRLRLALLAMLMGLSLYISVQAAEVYSDGYFYYHVYEGYNSICGYFGKETTVTVPSTIAGRPVSRIEAGTFNGCKTIKKLILPDTLMEIEEGAFSGAKNLEDIQDASGIWKQQEHGENSESTGTAVSYDNKNGNKNDNKNGGIASYEYEETDDGQSGEKRQEWATTKEEQDAVHKDKATKDKKKFGVWNVCIIIAVVAVLVGIAGKYYSIRKQK